MFGKNYQVSNNKSLLQFSKIIAYATLAKILVKIVKERRKPNV